MGFRSASRTLAAAFVATTAIVFPQETGMQELDHTRYMLALGDRTSKPIGHYYFCQAYVNECVETARATLILTEVTERRLADVNNHVNETIRPATDMDNHRVSEMWDFAENGQGDCEEYMLLKRRMLIAQGIPAGALLMAVGRRPDGEAHAVLVVNTDMGQLVLDNLSDQMRWIEDTGYIYIKASLGDSWYDFQRPTPDITLAQGPQ